MLARWRVIVDTFARLLRSGRGRRQGGRAAFGDCDSRGGSAMLRYAGTDSPDHPQHGHVNSAILSLMASLLALEDEQLAGLVLRPVGE